MKNIMFIGKAGTGKTTLSNYLVQNFNYQHLKFASPVYDICKQLGMQNKERNMLQVIGTDIGRNNINKDIWANYLETTLYIMDMWYAFNDITKYYCIDDCRFINEFIKFTDKGFYPIFLTAPTQVLLERTNNNENNYQHSSEQGYNEILNYTHAKSIEFTVINTYVTSLTNSKKKLNSILSTVR